MTEPEQWARDLWQRALDADEGIWDGKTAALTIQRAFEDQTRELRENLSTAARLMERLRDFDGWQGTFHAGHAYDAKQEAIAFLQARRNPT